MTENPNEYNDEAFLRATELLTEAVVEMWEAGAEAEEIQDTVKRAIPDV